MNRLFSPLSQWASGKAGAKAVVLVWILIAIVITGVGDMARNHAVNVPGRELPDDWPSVVAQSLAREYLGEPESTPAILTFYKEDGIGQEVINTIASATQPLSNQEHFPFIRSVVPLHFMPEVAQRAFLSEDKTTYLLPISLHSGMEMEDINTAMNELDEWFSAQLDPAVDLYITGPAGIASDAIAIFQNADLVLLFSTLVLILALLIVIYRSPLLALIPLLAAGIVYQVIDQILGFMAAREWLALETQSLSIMSILLFAIITDYSMFIFSRFREQLLRHEDKHVAMKEAMKGVAEPIFFSGGTIVAAVLMLFFAVYEPYRNFAPVFSIATAIILVAGLTLIPALFTLFGRRAFWPVIPKVGGAPIKATSFWGRVGTVVTKHPRLLGALTLILFLGFAVNITNINYSFNLLESFPQDSSSRMGFELLAEKYAPGDLAATTVVIASHDDSFGDIHAQAIANELSQSPLVATAQLGSDTEIGEASDGARIITFELTLPDNPYSLASLDAIDSLRESSAAIIENAGLSQETTTVWFAGETAKQADVRRANQRDTLLTVVLVTIVITVMLGFQTRSFVAPLYMMGTILLSYLAAMGLSTFVFQHVFDYETMSYRIPLYTFVFLVALGVDYNIMLMSRIKEELREHSVLEAVQRSVQVTGSVISSAGIILAATFAVLMTQPIMELFLFGFAMAVGILMDTFLVRGFLIPSIVLQLGKRSFWPYANQTATETVTSQAR